VQLVACERCHAQFEVSTITETRFRCPCGATVWNRVPAPVDAPIQRCASCGAAVPATATTCDYCTSPIVRDKRELTLICPECFARCAANARYCGHCGVEFRPQSFAGAASALSCPACETAELRNRSIAAVAVHECPECNGLWVPAASFDLLVERARSLPETARPSQGLRTSGRHGTGALDGNNGGEGGNGGDEGEVVYRRCPVCRSPMLRKNFGHASGVIVDWCGPHGTWLDADELERIAAFIRSGGLERALAARAAEQAATHASSNHLVVPGTPGTSEPRLIFFEHLMNEQRRADAQRPITLVDLLREFLKRS
jgi:Zn-finger nucleic acid-binding protein/ribosomal protein L40E